ncbi:MAG: universal stress protein, partial [Alphaproteobacteria bacterium]
TPLSAVDDASAIADALGTQITAIAFEIRFQGPAPVHFLANLVVDMPRIIAAERKKSSDNARDLIAAFTRSAALRNLSHDHILERCEPSDVQGSLVEYARLRDLTIVVVPDEGSAERQLAESTIFGAGRPVMILPGAAKRDSPMALDNIVVAWDSSRAAARALCDAMPILEKAKLVRVVTVTNEQPVDTSRPIDQSRRGKELVRHLALHGVETALEVIDARGTPIGDVFEAYATSCKADLFVMGAFGHSRLRDFMLGGATQSMLDRCPLPLFLSH